MTDMSVADITRTRLVDCHTSERVSPVSLQPSRHPPGSRDLRGSTVPVGAQPRSTCCQPDSTAGPGRTSTCPRTPTHTHTQHYHIPHSLDLIQTVQGTILSWPAPCVPPLIRDPTHSTDCFRRLRCFNKNSVVFIVLVHTAHYRYHTFCAV